MYRLATTLIKITWALAALICVGFLDSALPGSDVPPPKSPRVASAPPPGSEPSVEEEARRIANERKEARRLVDEASAARATEWPEEPEPIPVTYGPGGSFITLEEYWKAHPDAAKIRDRIADLPRRKWRYRTPTATPSPAQFAWVRLLPNYEGLRARGLDDTDILQSFAPNEVKALEGSIIPDHLRPDVSPAIVYINRRCADGTCITGHCKASQGRLLCKDGRCLLPRR